MDEFALLSVENAISDFLNSYSDYAPELYRHDHDGGIPETVDGPRLIVALYEGQTDIGWPKGPAIDIPFVELTMVAVYIETPFVVENPAGDPDELNGETAIHIPVCRAFREWLIEKRLDGIDVPVEVTEMGCTRTNYGMWQPPRRESWYRNVRDRYWRHVFFVVLQSMEVT